MALENSLKRSQKSIEEDIDRLQEWLILQPHLPQRIDKEILFSFVNGTKSLEIAKQKLDAYFTAKKDLPQFFHFSVRDVTKPDYINATKPGHIFFLPKATPDGLRVLFTSLSGMDQELFDHVKIVTGFFMTLDLAIKLWPEMRGICVIADMSGFSAALVKKINLSTMVETLKCIQNCYPVKMKKALAINAPPALELICNKMVKPFLTKKLFMRITVTIEDKSCLKDVIPEELLPADYGGKEKTSSELKKNWMELLIEKRSWFENTSHQVVDETKRPADSKATYGTAGTFRSLAID